MRYIDSGFMRNTRPEGLHLTHFLQKCALTCRKHRPLDCSLTQEIFFSGIYRNKDGDIINCKQIDDNFIISSDNNPELSGIGIINIQTNKNGYLSNYKDKVIWENGLNNGKPGLKFTNNGIWYLTNLFGTYYDSNKQFYNGNNIIIYRTKWFVLNNLHLNTEIRNISGLGFQLIEIIDNIEKVYNIKFEGDNLKVIDDSNNSYLLTKL